MKKYKIKTSIVCPEGPKAKANKTVFILIFILIFVGNCLLYDAIHDFSVLLFDCLSCPSI